MSGPMHIALVASTLAVLGIFLVAAGLCFRGHAREGLGIHLVKVTGPLSSGLVLYALYRVPPPSPCLAGAALLLLGLALGFFLWALRTHGPDHLTRIYAADPPTRLIVEGPYRLVRHPCYAAYLLAFTAAYLATLVPWLLPVVVGNLALYTHAAWTEERKFAKGPLGEAYAAYRRRTGMFLPNPLKLLKLLTRD